MESGLSWELLSSTLTIPITCSRYSTREVLIIRKIQVAKLGTPKENMEYKTSSRSYRTFFFADEEFYRFFLLLSKDILLQMIFIYVTNMQALLQKIGQKKKFYRICYRASFSRVWKMVTSLEWKFAKTLPVLFFCDSQKKMAKRPHMCKKENVLIAVFKANE